MQLYPENYDVTISFAFTDYNGADVEPVSIVAALYNGDEELVFDFGSVAFDLADGKVDVMIPAEFNYLGDEMAAARILRVTLETAAGAIHRSSSYIVEGEVRLSLMRNSFQSIEAAELLARDVPNLAGWSGAPRDARFAALISAYYRLTRIPLRFVEANRNNIADRETLILREAPRGTEAQDFSPLIHATHRPVGYNREFPLTTNVLVWSTMTSDDLMLLPLDFRRKLRLAQLAEANEMLENDAVARKHRAGIISETVGESSVMLRGNRLELGIGRAALEYLTGHIYYNFKVARA